MHIELEEQYLKKQWIEIKASTEQATIDKLSQIYAEKLNGLNPGTSREEISTFFKGNLSKTKFSTYEDAMKQFDEIAAAGTELVKKYSTFFEESSKATPEQLKKIFKY